jgi:hypothetical protein
LVSPRPPLFHCRSRTARVGAARKCRGRTDVGHAAPPDRHVGPTPLPHPLSSRGAARDPSPSSPRRYKSFRGQLSPLFHPMILPPRQGHAQHPTSPPLPPIHSGQPERRRLPQVYHCRHHLFPPSGEHRPRSSSGQVAMPLTFLSTPRAAGPCRRRRSSLERRRPRRNVVAPPHPPPCCRPIPLVSRANILLAR